MSTTPDTPRTVQLCNRTRSAPASTSNMISAVTPARRPATRVAASAVFRTYELCELILLQLPIMDIYVVQRVHTIWRDTIARSEALQKKMFRVASGTPLQPLESTHDQMPTIPPAPNYGHHPAYYIGPNYAGPYLQPNPAMSMEYDLGSKGCSVSHWGRVWSAFREKENFDAKWSPRSIPLEIDIGEWLNHTHPRPSFRSARDLLQFKIRWRHVNPPKPHHILHDGTWRSMFITQPPVTGMQLQTSYYRNPHGWQPGGSQMSLYNPSGITLGEIYDRIASEALLGVGSSNRIATQTFLLFGQTMADDDESGQKGECKLCRWGKCSLCHWAHRLVRDREPRVAWCQRAE